MTPPAATEQLSLARAVASDRPSAPGSNGHDAGHLNGTTHVSNGFDLAALLAGPGAEPLDLLGRHVNPALASVLRTIGFDPRFVRADGAYLYDDTGRRFLDCLGGYAVFAAGRNHPVIRDALLQALALDLPNMPGVGAFRVAGLLARELLALAPQAAGGAPPLSKVFFASGGGEANDAAIKLARAATARPRIVYCQDAYHGLTMGSLSVNGHPEFRSGFGPLLADTTPIPFNDPVALERELARGDVAGFIVEPIQGKGVHLPGPEYLRAASTLCRRHGALLILDEIQTGLGRTGRTWACEHFGAGSTGPEGWTPDLMVVSKALSGGYVPVSAVLMTDRVYAGTFTSMSDCARIQTTFGMNDLAMVAGLAMLHVLKADRLADRAAAVGDRLTDRLRSMVGRHEMVADVRGKGLMIAIEFARPQSRSLRIGWDLLHRLDQSLFCQAVIMPLMTDHRIITQVAGHGQDVIKLIPPLVLSEADADVIADAFETCVAACHRFPGPAWEVGKKLTAAAARRVMPA